MEKLLSICIPTYNRAEIVFECVKNCLKNEYDFLEVVVTDNCSTDTTEEKLSQIKDSRFKYYKNKENIGYANLSMCMKNGSGKYCLLLSDEDEIYDIDWKNLKSFLEVSEDISVFQCEYYDVNGKQLLKGPLKRLLKDQYETYLFVQKNFGYAGGSIIKREVLCNVWEGIRKDNLLWNLYCEILLPMNCAKYGDICKMVYFKVRRTKRDGKGRLDIVNAWNGGESEPYWSIYSRRKQILCWFEEIGRMDLSDVCKQKLLCDNRNNGIERVYSYYLILHEEEYLRSSLLQKRLDIVNRDRKKDLKSWLRLIMLVKKEVDYKWKESMRGMRRNITINIRYNLVEYKILFMCILKIILREKGIKGKYGR